MKFNRKDIEDLRIELNITLEKEDYITELDKKLKEQQKTATFKGFRKGKVPISLIKKMYGNSMLADMINEILGKKMDETIKAEEIKYIGEPMLAEGQAPLDLDINNLGEYSFTFDIGLRPEIKVQGVGEEDEYEKMDIDVDDKTIDGEMDLLRRRSGKQESVEEKIEESDILSLDALELDGKKLKEKGWETSFTLMVESINDEKLKKQILKKKKGDSFDFDIYNLEKDRDDKFVKKYFLNLDENEEKEIGNKFRAKIADVKRLMPAEMDESFFTANFGEEAKNEEEARDFIKGQLVKFYGNEAKQLVYRNMMDLMIEKTEFKLPVSFLERWLKSQEKNKDLSEEEFIKQFESFLREMRWSMIKSELAEIHEVKVEEEEIQQRLYSKAQQYMNSQMQGMSDPTILNQLMEYMVKDRNQVNQAADEIATEKVFGKLADVVKLKGKKVGLEKFKDIVKKLNEELEAQ